MLRPSEEMQLVSRAGQERLECPGAVTSHSHAVVITIDSELPVGAVVVVLDVVAAVVVVVDEVAAVVVVVVVKVKAKIMLNC